MWLQTTAKQASVDGALSPDAPKLTAVAAADFAAKWRELATAETAGLKQKPPTVDGLLYTSGSPKVREAVVKRLESGGEDMWVSECVRKALAESTLEARKKAGPGKPGWDPLAECFTAAGQVAMLKWTMKNADGTQKIKHLIVMATETKQEVRNMKTILWNCILSKIDQN